MAGNLAVSFALKLNDQGSAPAARALQTLTRALKETGTVAKTSSQAAISAFQKLGSARETLGIRSEKAIQNEIRQTEAAYKRLAASGQASARELGRAQDAMRQKVAGLRQELEGAQRSAGGAGRAWQTAVGVVGAGAAAKMVLQDPVRRTMDFSMELAHTSNTLFAGRSVADRIAGKQQINDAVMAGVREGKGGVTREDALAGVKTLGASGVFGDDPRAAFAMLPTLTRAAAANNASVNDMANIAIKARETMGLTDVGRIMDMSAQGGIEGQFELRDMAKWLPAQMAYAKRVGLQGEAGYATLVAGNQLSMTTASSADAAGNNFKNLLSKINSPDTAKDLQKFGIDLPGRLAAAQAGGKSGLDAFLDMTEEVSAKDTRLVKLREQAKTAKGADLKANLEAQAGILEGSAIGKVIQDQESMGSLVALLNGRGRFDEIRAKALGANGTNDDLIKVVADEAGAKAQLAAAEAANNMQNALNKVNPLLGAAADGFSKLSQEFPTLAAAMSGGKLGVEALGAAAFTAAGALALLGKSVPGIPLPGSPLPDGKAPSTGSRAARIGKGLLGAVFSKPAFIAAGVGSGAYAIYKAAKGEDASNLASDIADWGVSKLAGRDESLGSLIYDMTHGDAIKKNSVAPVSMSFQDLQRSPRLDAKPQPVDVRVKVEVENGNIVASVNEYNARQASRN